MSNNKAREINSPIIKQLIDETTPEELAKIDAEMTNNKQQTAMKLYTEEDVLRAMMLCTNQRIGFTTILQEHLKPIELPSDEEIQKEKQYSTFGWGYEFGMNDGFKKGAKFVIDKIQGGNK